MGLIGHRRHRPRHRGRAARGARRRRAPRRRGHPRRGDQPRARPGDHGHARLLPRRHADRRAPAGARGAARVPRRAQRRACSSAWPSSACRSSPGRPRRGRRERRRRPAAHRRGDGAPRVRELDQRGVRALPAPRRPRLGRPPAARAGPRPQAAARVGRPARPRASRASSAPTAAGPEPHRARRRARRPRRHRVLLPAARRGDGGALPRAGARSTRWSPPAAPTTTGRVKPEARLGVGSLGEPVPDEVLADLRCVADDQLQRLG